AQAARWQASGHAPLVVAVNLSPRQFFRSDMVAWVADTLQRTSLPAECLELELTESLVAQDPDKVAATIGGLGCHGVRISIDDFGTGRPNLLALRQYRVGALKIGQSFVRDLCVDEDDAAVALAVISLAHSLGIRVIAEGVETAAQWDFLKRHG